MRLEDVADGVGTDPANIWRIEQGRQGVALEMLYSICNYYRIALFELVRVAEGGEPPKVALAGPSPQFIEVWNRLPDSGKSTVEDYLLEVDSLTRISRTFFEDTGRQRRHSFEEKLRSLPKEGGRDRASKPDLRRRPT